MKLDPRIPLLYEYYKVMSSGIIVNNLNIKEDINYWNVNIDLVTLGKERKINYFTYLDFNLNKISDCVNVVEKYVQGKVYKYLETADYTVLLDKDNNMVTEELTHGIQLFDLGGYTAIPFNEIKGYDTTNYRLFGYINKHGDKLKTYSFINEKDFRYIGKYSREDIIATVITENTNYIEGYIVESKGEGIIDSSMLHAHGTVTGLVYQGELEKVLKNKRINSRYIMTITSKQLSEFVKQRTIRVKLENTATHAIMFRCRE